MNRAGKRDSDPIPLAMNAVVLADCIDAMTKIPSQSFDLAIADPPYNASKGGEWSWDSSVDLPGFGGKWSKVMADWDSMELGAYLQFSLSWLQELKRVVKPTGSIWIHGTYHNIGILNFAMQLLGLEIINEVVWYKRNSFPNLSGRRLTASHETILWGHTGIPKKRRYYFDYETSKSISADGHLPKQAGKQMRTVWDIPNNKERRELMYGKHPTQKPLRLTRRMIALSGPVGCRILVPFAGSGTECVAAKEMGCEYLAFDNDPEYVELARRRVEATDVCWNSRNAIGCVPGHRDGKNK